MLSVDLGSAIRLQFDVGGRTGRLIGLWWVFRFMIGSLDPVATKLGQQNERKRTAATQNLTVKGSVNSLIINSQCVALIPLLRKKCAAFISCLNLKPESLWSYTWRVRVPHERWDTGCSLLLSARRETKMSQADKQPLLVILSVLWGTPMSTALWQNINCSVNHISIFQSSFCFAANLTGARSSALLTSLSLSLSVSFSRVCNFSSASNKFFFSRFPKVKHLTVSPGIN